MTTPLERRLKNAEYVCSDCGETYGKWREGVETWHHGICEVCGKEDFLCHVRRYSWLRKAQADPVSRDSIGTGTNPPE